jgi:hypothetical protein
MLVGGPAGLDLVIFLQQIAPKNNLKKKIVCMYMYIHSFQYSVKIKLSVKFFQVEPPVFKVSGKIW